MVNERRKLEPIIQLYKPTVRDRLPYLSFYNDYQDGLPKDFVVDFLIGMAFRYEDTLKSKSIYDLKNEVTEEPETY